LETADQNFAEITADPPFKFAVNDFKKRSARCGVKVVKLRWDSVKEHDLPFT
jgi:hypothetical protein